ncbi:unnamed protein product [Amoebophrya sp. A25]|nr:unnamed protein product [Amoebophrya sp. A25]|eukprot:GSA25T00021969001.1
MSKETSGDDTSSISSLSSTDSDRVKNILSRWRRPSGPRITTESAASKFLALRKPKAKASPNKGDNSSSSADSLSAQSDSDGTQSRPLSQSQSPPAKKDDKNAATDAATEKQKRKQLQRPRLKNKQLRQPKQRNSGCLLTKQTNSD